MTVVIWQRNNAMSTIIVPHSIKELAIHTFESRNPNALDCFEIKPFELDEENWCFEFAPRVGRHLPPLHPGGSYFIVIDKKTKEVRVLSE